MRKVEEMIILPTYATDFTKFWEAGYEPLGAPFVNGDGEIRIAIIKYVPEPMYIEDFGRVRGVFKPLDTTLP